MKSLRIIKAFLRAILFLVCCVLITIMPDQSGIWIVVVMLAVLMLGYGLKNLIYYFTMGIHMVGGKTILYEGIILFDLGLFTLTLNEFPKQFVMIYLSLYYLVTGAIELYRMSESKKINSKQWIWKLVNGLIYVAFAILCLINMGSMDMMIETFCSALIYSAVSGIVSAFRKETFVYIQ